MDAAEVRFVVVVQVELRVLARRDRADARLERLALTGGEVRRDVAQRPGADAGCVVVGRQPDHCRNQLLAGRQLVDDGVAHRSEFIRRARGLAASSSAITAVSTSSGAPSRSSTGPQLQPSRYASMSVEPSFIA